MGRGKMLSVWLMLVLFLIQPVCVQAAAVQAGQTEETDQVTDQLTDELLEELELEEMERFLQEQQQEDDLDISFLELIKSFLSGEKMFDISRIWSWV